MIGKLHISVSQELERLMRVIEEGQEPRTA
jgi:hypothetical protein